MWIYLKSLLNLTSLKAHKPYVVPGKYPPNRELSNQTLVFDVEGGLLRSSSTFPYFMLMALEAGGFLRGLLLLLFCPLICCLSQGLALRVMVMICFFGIKRVRILRVASTVLPKFFLEDVGLEGFEVLSKGGKRVCISAMPRIMVEAFLKEYLQVEVVVGRKMKVIGGYCCGLMEEEKTEIKDFFNSEVQVDDEEILGISRSKKSPQHPLFSYCKEIYMVSQSDKKKWQALPRDKYPKPLIFHDGRLAFMPTPLATLAMFVWLPFGFFLCILRLIVVTLLPFGVGLMVLSMTGISLRCRGSNNTSSNGSAINPFDKGHLYVCNHRSLMDPICVAFALRKPVTALAYSVSKLSKQLSPVRVTQLSRNREEDRKKMERLLSQGKRIVVTPEGTTCREPYLLRFSPLFAELTDEIVPVATDLRTTMFHANTAGGVKAMDPLFYALNTFARYDLEFMDKIDTSIVKDGKCSSIDMSNHVQKVIGRALGFECTKLTRKDKYMVLAGTDGMVAPKWNKQ